MTFGNPVDVEVRVDVNDIGGSQDGRNLRFVEYSEKDNVFEQILLRKVGGGYIFLHRLLLNYFADLETGSDSKVLAEDRQEILPPESVFSTSAEPSEADSYMDVPTAQLISTSILSEVPRLLPCGHEQRTLNARFCSVCGQPVPSSILE